MTTDLDQLTPEEQDLHDRFERSLADVHGDARCLEMGAVVRGRTLRRRRRAGATLAGAGVLAAVAALVGPSLGGSGADHARDVASGPSPADQQPSSGAAPSGWWDMPADVVHDRLLPLLPGSVSMDSFQLAPPDRAPGEPDVSAGWLRARLTDGTGRTGDFEIFLYAPTPVEADGEPSTAERTSCPADPGEHRTCQELDDASGHHVGLLQTWTVGDVVVREAAMRRDDGGVVYAATANSTDRKWGWGSSISADLPPLTLDELRSVVEADTWTDWEPPGNR